MIVRTKEQMILKVPSLSFITVLSNPFLNRQSQLTFSLKTFLNKTLFEIDFFDLVKNYFNSYADRNKVQFLDIIFVAPHMDSYKYLVNKDDFSKEYPHGNLLYVDLEMFIKIAHSSNFMDRTVIFIFIGFRTWHEIVADVYNYSLQMYGKPLNLSGGDSSKRHLINDITIILMNFINMCFNYKQDIIKEQMIFNINKNYIAPRVKYGSLEELVSNHLKPQIEQEGSTNNNNNDNDRNFKEIFEKYYNNEKYYIKKNEDKPISLRNIRKDINKFINPSSIKNNYHTLTHRRLNSTLSKKPQNLSFFLDKIREVININKNDMFKAQKEIEEKWIEIGYNSFNLKSSFFKNSNNIFKYAFETLEYIERKGVFTRSYKELSSLLIDKKFLILTFSFLITFHYKTSETNLASIIGRNIFMSIYKDKYKKSQNADDDDEIELKFDSFDDFCNHFFSNKNYNEQFIRLGTIFIDIFTTQIGIKIFERKNMNDEGYFLYINPEYVNEIQENLIINPQSLPMICKPNLWSDSNYGGFLLNIENEKSLITGSEHHSHSLKKNQKIYDSVNYLNSLKFSVNSDFINYIENEGSFILDHYKSSKSYINNIIAYDIAKVYKNFPFYLNVNLDWRGRIYTHSFYLDYQGSDFSLSLINLYKGEKLTEKGLYFYYVYGANSYNEHNISKKSFQDRYNWVIEKSEKIYSMDKDFILKAESPAVFAAFCLNFKKIQDDPNYIHYTPCFLDATCSGIQHFAGMLLDYDLAYNVNLIKSENVQDLYSSLIDPINEAINNSWRDKEITKDKDLTIFSEVKLTRKELKKIIMVKSYNVTLLGMAEHLKATLIKEPYKKLIISKKNNSEMWIDDYLYHLPAKNKDGYVKVDDGMILELANIINKNIFNRYNSLKEIYLFLTDLAKCMITLELPITWATPLGLEIIQHYNLSIIKKISINFLGKSKTTVLREWTNDIDIRKQLQAIIPNIVHSFDATHLIKVIVDFDHNKYLLPIHDCFGSHPNDMFYLSDLVKKSFVAIYSNYDFLKELNNNFLNDLHKHRIKIIKKNDIDYVRIYKNNSTKSVLRKMPELPVKGQLNIKDVLDSKYLIS